MCECVCWHMCACVCGLVSGCVDGHMSVWVHASVCGCVCVWCVCAYERVWIRVWVRVSPCVCG